MADSDPLPGPTARFATTRWSQVLGAASADAGRARAALAWLVERYWQPLVAHARRRGRRIDAAEDAVQHLLLRLIERGDLATADPTKGRFRSFLLACLNHQLTNETAAARALKRGAGQVTHLDDEAVASVPASDRDADAAFDRDWAQAVLATALDRLASEQAATANGAARWAALRPYLSGSHPGGTYAEVGAALGLSEGAVKVAIHRLRQRLGDLLREEVAETIADPSRPGAVDEELRALIEALRPA